MRKIMTLLVGLMIAPVTAGCGSMADEFCDQKCSCEKCSDRKYDQCVVEYNAVRDTASVYDCDLRFEDVHECTVRDNVCVLGNFSADLVDCGGRINALNKCIDDNSSL